MNKGAIITRHFWWYIMARVLPCKSTENNNDDNSNNNSGILNEIVSVDVRSPSILSRIEQLCQQNRWPHEEVNECLCVIHYWYRDTPAIVVCELRRNLPCLTCSDNYILMVSCQMGDHELAKCFVQTLLMQPIVANLLHEAPPLISENQLLAKSFIHEQKQNEKPKTSPPQAFLGMDNLVADCQILEAARLDWGEVNFTTERCARLTECLQVLNNWFNQTTLPQYTESNQKIVASFATHLNTKTTLSIDMNAATRIILQRFLVCLLEILNKFRLSLLLASPLLEMNKNNDHVLSMQLQMQLQLQLFTAVAFRLASGILHNLAQSCVDDNLLLATFVLWTKPTVHHCVLGLPPTIFLNTSNLNDIPSHLHLHEGTFRNLNLLQHVIQSTIHPHSRKATTVNV